MGVPQQSATVLHCGNPNAIQIAHTDVFHERTKHIENDCHFVRHHLMGNTLLFERTPKSDRKKLLETLKIEVPDFDYGKDDEGEKECVICLREIEEGEKCRRMSMCDHVFHRDCIDRWFMVDPHCPLCRTAVCVVVVEK
ncbi:E3 ubiquitin-protein ligase ATL41-like [Benincasa hispida]|uniref:E3 ubiquitin-protein ligase ATL41-like n=1 Tax=Benincasa hispida TaxID=102211 RepID=UPI001901007B|nr:E3 ubiquitin-protein ligase ATL41-like [Benincasa hispida]